MGYMGVHLYVIHMQYPWDTWGSAFMGYTWGYAYMGYTWDTYGYAYMRYIGSTYMGYTLDTHGIQGGMHTWDTHLIPMVYIG